MRYLLFCLVCLPAVTMAQQAPDHFDQEKFEKHFHAADKDGDGRLSREEASTAFPKAMKFFVEIDANNDNYITLIEVNQARARRINAALNANTVGAATKYVKPDDIGGSQVPSGGEPGVTDLSSAIAQTRSSEFDEFLDDEPGDAANHRGPAPVKSTTSNLLKKSF